jgi:dihydroorotase
MNELIRQVRFLNPVAETEEVADVWLADGKIKRVGASLKAKGETTVIEGKGLVLAPGLVDLYSYSGEPGYEDRETIASLGASAIAGGFTRLTLLPSTVPPVDSPATVTLIKQLAGSFSSNFPKLEVWGALTRGTKGEQMTELAQLAPEVQGFSDGRPLENLGLVRRLLEYLRPLGKPIALMPVDLKLRGEGVMREGELSVRCGLPGESVMAESSAIATLIEMVIELQTPIHIMRVSTARGVALIASAKAQGLPITASTPWTHLLLDTETIAQTYDPNLRLDPPLGNPRDKEALREGVKTGIIDAIAIDHRPYTYEEKTLPFPQTVPGMIGFELALPLLWQNLVVTGEWSALTLWKALSSNPQKCLLQTPIPLQAGERAELILFNPQQPWQVTPQTLKSSSENTFWLGQSLQGKVVKVWS